MSLTQINNGDTGLQARTKINASFTAIDNIPAGATGPSGSSGSSGTSGSAGTSGTSPSVTAVLDIINTSTIISTSLGATGSSTNQIIMGSDANAGAGEGNMAIGGSAVSNGTTQYPGTAIGFQSIAGLNGVSIGRNANSNASGTTAIAIGNDCTASGAGSIAIQRISLASGDFSTAVGYGAQATGENAQAFGSGAQATHANSVSLGYGITSVVAAHTHVKSLYINTVAVYADNTAALAGGLVAGQVYRTSTGVLMITY